MILIITCIFEGFIVALVSYFIALKTRISKFDYHILDINKNTLEEKVKRLEIENGQLNDRNSTLDDELRDIKNRIVELEYEKEI